MDNAVEAMKMAFAMIVFIIALSATMYLLNTASSTSRLLLYYADESNYLDNIELGSDDVRKRIVNVETIIPTLYRYYKENFAVQIYNKSGTLVQIFDVNIEGKLRRAAGTTEGHRTYEQNALMFLYGVKTEPISNTNPYLFEAPWIGNTSKDIKTRVDLYVKGECAYINGTLVDYRQNNLLGEGNSFGDNPQFEEEFIQYTYKGDTISVGEGEDMETITGNSKPEDKIVIIYRQV